jgi:hypothetical protein
MAMEKYQDDPDVKFLFIDTGKTAANYKELVRKFLADNHYAFHTVFDEKSDDGKMDVNFKKYVMPGIPAKYFIDGNGIIKYRRPKPGIIHSSNNTGFIPSDPGKV